MTISLVGTNFSVLVQSVQTMDRQLTDLERQLSTGQKSDTYSGLGSQSGVTVALNAQLSAISSYDDTILNVGTSIKIAQTALTQIASAAGTVQSSTIQPVFSIDSTGQTSTQKAAQAQLDSILGLLNTQVGNNYICSGSAVDRPAVDTLDHILNGNGAQAGLKQVISERQQADLGVNGLGRLAISSPTATSVSVAEDAASPFGFKLSAVNSTLTGATVTGPSGSPASLSVDFGGTNPNAGDAITLSFALPDGTTQSMTLTATTASPPGANQFTIGATPADTATNLQGALTASIGQLASTSLSAASAMAASNDFFGSPPQRVNGPPFDTATSLVNGTSANTVSWYTGEDGATPARSTASARIDSSITVSYGMRANEQGIRWLVQNIAALAATSYSSSNPNASGSYAALNQRVDTALAVPNGVQNISDIEASLASAQVAMNTATDSHKQTQQILTDMLQNITTVSSDQVGAQLLALQTALQASMQATSLLSKLSMVNYMPAN